MGTPYIAEIRLMSFGFPPRGWAECNGQLLQINQNQALFSILGTMYGGDGRVTFALPDLRGRVPMGFDPNHFQGTRSGSETITLSVSQMPTHTHMVQASTTNGDSNAAQGRLLAAAPIYAGPTNFVTLNPQTVGNAGGNQPHENMQPYSCLNFCIALVGIFPSRN